MTDEVAMPNARDIALAAQATAAEGKPMPPRRDQPVVKIDRPNFYLVNARLKLNMALEELKEGRKRCEQNATDDIKDRIADIHQDVHGLIDDLSTLSAYIVGDLDVEHLPPRR